MELGPIVLLLKMVPLVTIYLVVIPRAEQCFLKVAQFLVIPIMVSLKFQHQSQLVAKMAVHLLTLVAEVSEPLLITQVSVLHLDAGDGVVSNEGVVSSWLSKTNSSGNAYSAAASNNAITYVEQNEHFNNQPTVSVSGSGYLNNTNFNEMVGATDFTRIVVLSHDLTGNSDNNVAFWDGVTGSTQYYSSGWLYSYNGNGSKYASLSGFFNSGNQYKPMVIAHRLDSSASTNSTKVKVQLNKEVKTINSFTGTQSTTSTGTGFRVSHSSSSATWKGDVAEVLLFNRRLKDAEVEVINEHLMIKYGLAKTCKKPASIPNGYQYTSCNTSSGDIAASQCEVSCANGFTPSRTYTPYVTCSDFGEDFDFHGCYATWDDGRTPPSFVNDDHVGRWDAFNGVSLDLSDKVIGWTSYPIKSQNNATPKLTPSGESVTLNLSNPHLEIVLPFISMELTIYKIMILLLSRIKLNLQE